MITTQTAESVALALDRRAPNLDGVSTIVQAAAMLRSQAAEIERLRLDAERYRFCFDSDNYAVCRWETPAPFSDEYGDWKWLAKDEADQWIDAARAALGEKL